MLQRQVNLPQVCESVNIVYIVMTESEKNDADHHVRTIKSRVVRCIYNGKQLDLVQRRWYVQQLQWAVLGPEMQHLDDNRREFAVAIEFLVQVNRGVQSVR